LFPLIKNIPKFRTALLSWYDAEQRPLPWRTTPSLYRTVVSEFMLQQTQVKTALPYFEQWMHQFPNFDRLAKADIEVVLKYWEGLGYYNRARNLHKLAKAIIQLDEPPKTPEHWKLLPGIGDYTSAAIASIAQNYPAAVVDGNVVRVLARISNENKRFSSNGQAVEFFRDSAEALLDPIRPGDANQAIMELGATVCVKAATNCPTCPVQSFCSSYKSGDPKSLPNIVRPKRTKVFIDRAIIIKENAILLHKIPSNAKRLSDHFELPNFEAFNINLDAQNESVRKHSIKRRSISNQSIVETLYEINSPLAETVTQAVEEPSKREAYWIDLKAINSILLSGPHKRWIEELKEEV